MDIPFYFLVKQIVFIELNLFIKMGEDKRNTCLKKDISLKASKQKNKGDRPERYMFKENMALRKQANLL